MIHNRQYVNLLLRTRNRIRPPRLCGQSVDRPRAAFPAPFGKKKIGSIYIDSAAWKRKIIAVVVKIESMEFIGPDRLFF